MGPRPNVEPQAKSSQGDANIQTPLDKLEGTKRAHRRNCKSFHGKTEHPQPAPQNKQTKPKRERKGRWLRRLKSNGMEPTGLG